MQVDRRRIATVDIAQGLQIGISLAATRRHDRRFRT